VGVLEELDPKFDVGALRDAIARRAGEAQSVAVVGHEPQLSSLLAALSGVSQTDLDVKKGAIVRVDVDTLTNGTSADPRWWLKPRKGTRVKGLPLQKDMEAADDEEADDEPATPPKREGKKDKGAGSRPVRSATSGGEPRTST